MSTALVPGLTLCVERCGRFAELTVDPAERWARPLCFECVEELVERENAVAVSRDALERIDQARKNVRYRPLPPARVDLETADQTKLNELRAQWRAYERSLSVTPRCWAIRADGSRCIRVEAEAGLCETHLATGARLPGLGWNGDTPVGATIIRQRRRSA